MTPEEAAEWFVGTWEQNYRFEGKTPYETALEIIQAQRQAAKEEALTQVLTLIDSQTHTSELGDPYRHMRALVEALTNNKGI